MNLCRQTERPSAKPSRDNQLELQEQQQSQMCLQLLTNLSQPSWSVSRHFAYAKKKKKKTNTNILLTFKRSHMEHVREIIGWKVFLQNNMVSFPGTV